MRHLVRPIHALAGFTRVEHHGNTLAQRWGAHSLNQPPDLAVGTNGPQATSAAAGLHQRALCLAHEKYRPQHFAIAIAALSQSSSITRALSLQINTLLTSLTVLTSF